MNIVNKVLFYTERWLDGGIESLIINIIENSSNNTIYKILTSQKETNSFDKLLEKKNVEIFEIHKKSIKNPIIRTIKSIVKFKSKIKKYNKYIIHINIYNAVGLIYAYIASKSGFNKIIIHAHNNGIDIQNDKFYIKRIVNYIFKKIFTKKGYYYIACSDEAADFCYNTKKINNNYYIMKNGIYAKKFIYNIDLRKKIRKQLKIDDNIVLYGHVGRFVYQKNHEFLLKTFKKINEKNKNSKLLLIGNGPLYENMINLSKKLNIYDNVIFLGNSSKVNEYMQAMDIFLFPSCYEGLGIALVEAQASGLKCIASKNIPKLVKCTDNILFLDLNEDMWCDESIKAVNYIRKNLFEKIKKSGFDIGDSVLMLEKKYEVIFNDKKK